MTDERSLSSVPVKMRPQFRRPPIDFSAVWVVTNVLFLLRRAVSVAGFCIGSAGAVRAGAVRARAENAPISSRLGDGQ